MKKRLLSKSKYMNGLQCPKYLWLVFNDPAKIAEPDESTQFIFDEGHRLGELAKRLFPNGSLNCFLPRNYAIVGRSGNKTMRSSVLNILIQQKDSILEQSGNEIQFWYVWKQLLRQMTKKELELFNTAVHEGCPG